MKRLVNLLVIIYIAISLKANDEARLLRFPSAYQHQLVFSYGGDLYESSINGGEARKLTNHKGYEMFARFSPDGKSIAFTAQYDGNTEVYLIPSAGGTPKRLTYTAVLGRDDIGDRMGPNNIVMGWTPDSKYVIYRSRKQSFNDFKGMLFKVSVNGGLSEELPFSVAGFCSYSPDGKRLAYNRVFREFRTWKYYKGGMADDIRIFDMETKTTQNITSNTNQDIIPMWVGDDIFYASDRDRTMNIFAYNLKTLQTRKVTNFTEYDVKFPSANGTTIVFENGGYIYKLDANTGQYSKISITINDDGLWARNDYKDASKNIRTADVSPNGERVVFGARGEVFTVPADKGYTRNISNTPGAHERDVAWSPDGKYIAYVGDNSGEYEIYMQKQDGSEPPVQLTKNADTYKYSIMWSSDSKKILWSDRKFRLQYVDIATKETTLAAISTIGTLDQYSWSADSRWIMFTKPAVNGFNVISVYNVDNKSIHDITDTWFNCTSPAFSTDGKYIVYASSRDFNPIYSQTEWNHAYLNMEKIYVVPLKNDQLSPFAPENNEVKLSADDSAPKAENAKDKAADKQVEIDFDGIVNRAIALPVTPSNYSDMMCIGNLVYYIEHKHGEAPAFKMYDLKKQEETELGKNMRYAISANNKKMLVKDNDRWGVVDLPSSKIILKDVVDVSEMKVPIDYSKEWEQIYNECWRQMRDFFYVENMHGVNWQAMHDKYFPLIKCVRHRDDLTYIIGELIGELNIGHAYINSGEKVRAERIPMGLLGAKLSRHPSGYYKIDKILEGANWSNDLRSPLLEPGLGVNNGDYIIAINGISVQNCNDIYQLLVYKADKEVELTVNTKPDESGSRKILVTPIRDESNLYYYNWVQTNIRKVSDATDGEVGYVHIPDMGTEGLNEFATHFYPQLNKKALIIDDRGNGGGNVSPMIIERLQREITRSKMYRNSSWTSPVPSEMMMGPKVLLIDQYSASDGDLFAYAWKRFHLGTIVGKRTWGGVVGISGSLPFVDGTDLRKPEFASYSADSSAWIIEGYGVDPDVEVENDPAKEYMGIDDQLTKAIEIAKEKLKTYKALPAIPADPDKTK